MLIKIDDCNLVVSEIESFYPHKDLMTGLRLVVNFKSRRGMTLAASEEEIKSFEKQYEEAMKPIPAVLFKDEDVPF